jgi:predicted dithiol-disulfide oxidoreductase (DUF899 family)
VTKQLAPRLQASKHRIGTRQEWLAERLELLEAEKELTRRSDELAERRRALPWVRVDKKYRFATDEGSALLPDLFRGRTQLLVYHFMFGPDYKAGCPSCSSIADGFNGIQIHLANHDVMLWAVSRAPLSRLQEYKRRLGWTFPWASSFGNEFNFDYSVGFSPDEQLQDGGIEYNYRRESAWKPSNLSGQSSENIFGTGVDMPTYLRERPGVSAFVLEDDVLYHTYSTYARGLDGLWGMWQWLDRAPKGRNETGHWWRRHDEYEKG